jgi:hypothetical protein
VRLSFPAGFAISGTSSSCHRLGVRDEGSHAGVPPKTTPKGSGVEGTGADGGPNGTGSELGGVGKSGLDEFLTSDTVSQVCRSHMIV